MIPQFEKDILLAHTLRRDRTWLYAHPEYQLTRSQKTRFARLVRRRAAHEPVAYLLGYKDFYGLRLKVNRSVLIPRPETELLVDLVVRSAGVHPPHAENAKRGTRPRATIVDVGTGSGAIAIAIAKTVPNAKVIATDVSHAPLRVARENARRHGVEKKIKFRVGAGLQPAQLLKASQPKELRLPPLVICANLPYLTTAQWRKTARDVREYEPRLALDGGRDGLRYYKKLLAEVAATFRLRRRKASPAKAGGYRMLLEIDPGQTKKLRTLVRSLLPGATVRFHKDLSGRNRVCEIAPSGKV